MMQLEGMFGGAGKIFRVCLGDEDYYVDITRQAAGASHTRPEDRRATMTSLNECAEVIGELFRRLLVGGEVAGAECGVPNDKRRLWSPLDVNERVDSPAEVDVEAGWAVYRAEILETMGPTPLPRWNDCPAQLRECFAAGVYTALRGARVVAEDSFRWSIEGAMEVVNP